MLIAITYKLHRKLHRRLLLREDLRKVKRFATLLSYSPNAPHSYGCLYLCLVCDSPISTNTRLRSSCNPRIFRVVFALGSWIN